MNDEHGWITAVLLALVLGMGAWGMLRWVHQKGYGATLSADVGQMDGWVRGRLEVDLSAPETHWHGVWNGRCAFSQGGGCALSYDDDEGID